MVVEQTRMSVGAPTMTKGRRQVRSWAVPPLDEPPEPGQGPNRSGWWSITKACFRVGTSAVLIAFLIAQTNLGALTGALAHLQWSFFALALATYLASQALSARRWAGLANAVGFAEPQSRFLSLYYQGMFFGLCLPSSVGGDVVKAWKLGNTARQRILAACTVFVDRGTGLYALGLIAVAALGYHYGYLPPGMAPACVLAWLAGGVAAVGLGLAAMRRLAPALERLPRLGRIVVQLRPYHDGPAVVRIAVGYSLAIQGMNALTVLWIGQALGLAIAPATYFVAVPAAALVSALPVSFGGFGVRESVLALFLIQERAATESAVTVGLVWLAVILLSGLVGGVAYLLDRAPKHTPAACSRLPRLLDEGS